MTEVVTAAQVAQTTEPVAPAAKTRLRELGPLDGDQILVSAAALSALLRGHHLLAVNTSCENGWWTVDIPLFGFRHGTDDLADATQAATAAARNWAEDQLNEDRIDTAVWVIRASDDEALAAWFGLPQTGVTTQP